MTMNFPKTLQPRVDVVLCGLSATTLEVWEAARSLEACIQISGYWDPDYSGKSCLRPDGVQILSSTFDDLLMSTRYDCVFLCMSPQKQYKILQTSLLKLANMTPPTSKSNFPAVILIPPVSPCYDCIALSGARNFIGVAMPFRRLVPVSTLCAHLRSKLETSLSSSRYPSHLPSNWALGTLRSFHVRLRAANLIKADEYSWLCEPGAIGGGLLNIYGSSLIDLAFLLTAGLRITSVSCLCRTFDTEVSSHSGSIRRISADDYVVATAEMESKCGKSRGPVAVFCLAADMPSIPSGDTTLHNMSQHSYGDQFSLEIEIVGSSGRFLISSPRDDVRWSPVGRVVGPIFADESSQSGGFPTIVDYHKQRFQTGDAESPAAGNGVMFECEKQLDIPSLLSKTNGYQDPDLANSVTPLNKTLGPRETAAMKSSDQDLRKAPSTKTSHQVREIWKRWFTEMSSAIRGSSPRQSLEAFVATPEHWGYIQRVLIALDKAARMRCWVDVATGERV